jgi:hypothetical protein
MTPDQKARLEALERKVRECRLELREELGSDIGEASEDTKAKVVTLLCDIKDFLDDTGGN